ncbi:MAG: substrate-binding domain-containing protein [Candidatus Entotheonellia bacterium]
MQRLLGSLVVGLYLGLLVFLDGRGQGAEPKELRVCADPDNLPYSNEKLEGFENKIAALIAQDLGAKLTYTWWPHQRGLIRRTFNEGRCDVLIGIPKGYDPVLWTKPYYRTAYVIASVKDHGPEITSLDDPILTQVKIGVHVNTPPHDALAQRGIVGDNVVAYRLFHTPQANPEESPGQLIEDLLAAKIDVAFIWGPFAGYYVKKRSAQLQLVPLRGGGPATPFTFEISMGVRKGERALKAELEEVLDKDAATIRSILEEYGVPLVMAEASEGNPGQEVPRETREGAGGAHRH